MTRKAPVALPPGPEPEAVTTWEAKIEKRIGDLLDLATETKDLTAALKVAVAYYAVKKKVAEGDGWGAGLKDE